MLPRFQQKLIKHAYGDKCKPCSGVKHNPTCTCKKAQQTINHLIYECPDISQQRLKLINQIIQNGDSHKSTTNFQALEKFLRIC